MANRDNPRMGAQFEQRTQEFFRRHGIDLQRGFAVDVGVGSLKRSRNFDLGSNDPPMLVECKRHTWTEGGNSPSAKLAVWNEAMYFFVAAPTKYRKILFVLKSVRKAESLAQHYIKRFEHLIPSDVELWEYDASSGEGERLH